MRGARAPDGCAFEAEELATHLVTLSVETSACGLSAAFFELFATTSERILDDASPMRSESVAAIMRKTRPQSFGSEESCSTRAEWRTM